jgi:hypothetical protein
MKMTKLLDTIVIKSKLPKTLTRYGFDHTTVWQTENLANCCENYVVTKAGNLRRNVYRLATSKIRRSVGGNVHVYETELDGTVAEKHTGVVYAHKLALDPEDDDTGMVVVGTPNRSAPRKSGLIVQATLTFKNGKLTRVAKSLVVGTQYQRVG